MNFLEIKDIADAKKRIANHINTTPVVSSSLLNNLLGHEILFKAECLQKVGAFKARGACNSIAWLIEQNNKPKHIVANSSGNHSQAVSWAATKFGIPATIFMAETSSKVKVQATKSYGAEVILCKTRNEADQKAMQTSEESGTYWIPPFNHEQVIAGQGTAAFEALQEIGNVDAVFAPCGGGGLLSGTYVATKALSPNAEVWGAEPLNANDAAISLRKKSIFHFDTMPNTLADGAKTLSVGDITFEYLKKLNGIYEIEEEKIIYWTQWLTHLLKLHIEPTSALPMEAAKRWLQKQAGSKKVLIILSGGNVDQEKNKEIWNSDFLSSTPSIS